MSDLYSVKALLKSGIFEGKTTTQGLAQLENSFSDKELSVAAAFLGESSEKVVFKKEQKEVS